MGKVIDQSVVLAREGVRFGDGVDVVVAFPGTLLELDSDSLGWTVGGHRVITGRPLVLSYGAFEVSFEGVVEERAPRGGVGMPDLRLLVATFAVVLGGAWIDTVERVAHRHPELVTEIRARLFATDVPPVAEVVMGDTAAEWPEVDAWPPVERTIQLGPAEDMALGASAER